MTTCGDCWTDKFEVVYHCDKHAAMIEEHPNLVKKLAVEEKELSRTFRELCGSQEEVKRLREVVPNLRRGLAERSFEHNRLHRQLAASKKDFSDLRNQVNATYWEGIRTDNGVLKAKLGNLTVELTASKAKVERLKEQAELTIEDVKAIQAEGGGE